VPRFAPRIVHFFVCVALLVFSVPAFGQQQWARWRGPSADGHSAETNLPTTWSAADIAWKSPLPGLGHSSPVIWGERIFLTAALDGGRERVVLGINRNDGQILWQQTAWTGQAEPTHKMNGHASATCATDGKHVYAFFGRGGGLHCYTIDGEYVWTRDLGTFEGPWGTAACPILHGDLVIQNCDADAGAYIVALNKETGETVWKTDRPNHRGWSTPIIFDTGEREELIVNGHEGVLAYDPATGKELWLCRCDRGRGEPSVTPAGGLVYTNNGLSRGGAYAMKPGGAGDITETARRVWYTERKGGRDLPSPIVVDGYVLIMEMKGVLTCLDAADGKELWKGRIGGNFASSPTAYKGLAFFLNEDGETVVIKPGPQLEIVARNRLNPADDEIFRAVVTPSDGQIFLRSDRQLYCIGTRNPLSR
jgi:outer membrane protein assembly factor BamB